MALAQGGQQAAQFGQPDGGEVAVGDDGRAQGVDDGLVREAAAGLEGAAGEHGAPLGGGPVEEVAGEAGLADAGFSFDGDEAEAAAAGLVVGGDQLLVFPGAADEGQRGGRGLGGRGAGFAALAAAFADAGGRLVHDADALGQGGRFRGGFDAQLVGQRGTALFVQLQRARPVAHGGVGFHEAAVGALFQRVEGQPAVGDGDGGCRLAPFQPAPGQLLAELAAPEPPLLLLEGDPLVELGGVGQGEAFEEVAADLVDGRLHLLGISVHGLLDGFQVEGVAGVGVEADGVPLDLEVGGRLGRFGMVQRFAQEGQRGAQRGAAGFAVALRPEEGGQPGPGLHPPLHSQVDEQGQRLARGEGKGVFSVLYLRRAEEGEGQAAHFTLCFTICGRSISILNSNTWSL